MKKNLLFKIIAILLPFLFVLLFEGSLRIFNYGQRFDLFVEYPQTPGYIVFNPHASEKYFPDKKFATFGNSEFFKKKKDNNTIRFFVLGESTTIGFPYFHNGSFHRWLLYRLMHNYPDKNLEIINLSLTAVNSYTVKGFAEQLVNYEPDAVLIYVGQNEYFGGMGVASSQTIGGNPAVVNMILQMRQFRIVQLLMNGYGKISKLVHKQPEGELTRMELMIGDQKIPYRSKLFEKGIDQFKYNMNATLNLFQQKKIPVFFSNLVYNIKDLRPFISDEKESPNAMFCYNEAKSLYDGKNYEKAKESFVKAKELDLLRFRAPEELNTLIKNLCNQYPNTYFVDSKSELEKHAPHQILGEELFTDHVHPNIEGYSLMSNAFYNKIMESQILPKPQIEMSDEQLRKNMPISPVDSLAGEFRIMTLKGHWPFYDSLYVNMKIPENTIEEQLAAKLFRNEADWLDVHTSLYNSYINSTQQHKALKVAEGSVLEYAANPEYYESAAMMNGQIGNEKEALFYFKKSFQMAPSFDKARYIFVIYLKMDEPEKSIPYLDYSIADNKGMNLYTIKPLVEQIIQLQKRLKTNTADVEILNEIAEAYLKMENRDGAMKYVNMVLMADARNGKALEMKKKLGQ
jgi:tetratricopeptide (TPR) repeat protein